MELQQLQSQQQQLDINELFTMIGELSVKLRVANLMITQLKQEKANQKDVSMKKEGIDK